MVFRTGLPSHKIVCLSLRRLGIVDKCWNTCDIFFQGFNNFFHFNFIIFPSKEQIFENNNESFTSSVEGSTE